MWVYKITKNSLGFQVHRTEEKDGLFRLEWLGANQKWIKDKECAKLFYHQEDAISNLTLARFRGERGITSNEETRSIDKQEKKSWSEL